MPSAAGSTFSFSGSRASRNFEESDRDKLHRLELEIARLRARESLEVLRQLDGSAELNPRPRKRPGDGWEDRESAGFALVGSRKRRRHGASTVDTDPEASPSPLLIFSFVFSIPDVFSNVHR